MTVKQISVFLENRYGQLHEITNILAEAGVDPALDRAYPLVRQVGEDGEEASGDAQGDAVFFGFPAMFGTARTSFRRVTTGPALYPTYYTRSRAQKKGVFVNFSKESGEGKGEGD